MCIDYAASLHCLTRNSQHSTSLGSLEGYFLMLRKTMLNTGTKNVTQVDVPVKKYIRTTLKLDDGTYVPARINTETGEIKPIS